MPNASLRVLVPEGTTNYILNPTLRNDTTGWTATAGALISRSLLKARFGIASLRIDTNGTNLNEGAYFRVSDLAGIQDYITVSAYVRGTGKVRIRLQEQLGAQWSSVPRNITDTRWTRLEVTGRCTGKNDVRLYVETADSVPKGMAIYVDGAQMERKPYATTYCDGDQPGCRWNIQANSTVSTRDPYTRLGGHWIALAGPCRADDDIYVTAIGGMGMESITNNTQSFALAPGSYFQNSKVAARVITLTFNVKKKSLRNATNPSLDQLHALRQQLIDLFKPDKGRGDEEFIIEYTDGKYPIYLSVRYEAGLEGSWDVRNQWVNSFPVRFLACSPMFWEDDQETASLTVSDPGNKIGLGSVAGRIDGKWAMLNYGTNFNVESFDIGRNGELYACGNFTFVNNNAAAINPFVDARRVAVWDGIKWASVGVGANNTINDVAVSPTGYVYVTGVFTSIGGVACNYIAYWNPVASTWNAMGTGLNAQGDKLAISANGDVYVAGNFTTAGGVVCKYVARWDGSSWHSLGAAKGVNNQTFAIAINKKGTKVYIGGDFNAEFGGVGGTLNHVAEYDVATNAFSAMGFLDGSTTSVYDIAISPTSGTVFAAGDFLLAGTTIVNHIAAWNGSAWNPLGSGTDNTINEIDIDSHENVYAGGYFTLAGGVSCPSLALWNGSVWVNMDITIAKGLVPLINAIIVHPNGDLYLGGAGNFGEVGINTVAAAINLVTNVGSAEVSPIIYVRGPGKLRWIENQTTGKRVYMELPILNLEEVEIDFAQAKVTSVIRGDLAFGVLPGSEFKNFGLVPGENKLAIYMADDVAALMQIRYTPTHHSVDSTARGAELI